MKEVVIVSACRTAIGRFGGTLKDMKTAALRNIERYENSGSCQRCDERSCQKGRN